MIQQPVLIKPKELTWVVLAGIVAIVLNGICRNAQYSNDMFAAAIRYLAGEIPKNTGLYMDHAHESLIKIPLIKFSYYLYDLFSLQTYEVNYIYYFVFTLIVFVVFYLFFRKAQIHSFLALVMSIIGVILNPLSNIIYGYQYEVGRSIATFGTMAFSVITLLIYLLYLNKRWAHAIFLLILYFIHPLNSVLYGAFYGLYLIMNLLNQKNGGQAFTHFFTQHILSVTAVLVIFVLAMRNFTNIYNDSPLQIRSLIDMTNAYGRTGAFFYPWLNPNKLADFIYFIPAFFYLVVIGFRKNILDRRLFLITFSLAIFCLLMSLIHVVAYYLSVQVLLPLDLSRVFAWAIPFAYILVIYLMYSRYTQDTTKKVALLCFILLPATLVIHWLFPIIVFLGLHGKDENFKKYLIYLLGLFVPALLISLKPDDPFVSLANVFSQRTKLFLFLNFGFILFFINILQRKKLLNVYFVLVSLFIFTNIYKSEFLECYRSINQTTRNYRDLVRFMDEHVDKNDICWIIDNTFSLYSFRPHFLSANTIALAIYIGNIQALEKESKAVWGVSADQGFIDKLFPDKSFSNQTYLFGYMKERMQNVSKDQIEEIRNQYPLFKYIILEKDMNFTQVDLPVDLMYQNDGFKVYRVLI